MRGHRLKDKSRCMVIDSRGTNCYKQKPNGAGIELHGEALGESSGSVVLAGTSVWRPEPLLVRLKPLVVVCTTEDHNKSSMNMQIRLGS
jgi:hypothetical protein